MGSSLGYSKENKNKMKNTLLNNKVNQSARQEVSALQRNTKGRMINTGARKSRLLFGETVDQLGQVKQQHRSSYEAQKGTV